MGENFSRTDRDSVSDFNSDESGESPRGGVRSTYFRTKRRVGLIANDVLLVISNNMKHKIDNITH